MLSKLKMLSKLQIAIFAVGLAFCAGTAVAQVTTAPPAVAKSNQTKTQILRFRGSVMSATSAAITLRSRQNGNMIQTFSYSPQVHEQMLAVIQKGGFQYGDKVAVDYASGTTIALRIHGKPSKPAQ
jgi:hypothetical protein